MIPAQPIKSRLRHKQATNRMTAQESKTRRVVSDIKVFPPHETTMIARYRAMAIMKSQIHIF
jgi:ribosomal protein S4